jgi:hypothetical protein
VFAKHAGRAFAMFDGHPHGIPSSSLRVKSEAQSQVGVKRVVPPRPLNNDDVRAKTNSHPRCVRTDDGTADNDDWPAREMDA